MTTDSTTAPETEVSRIEIPQPKTKNNISTRVLSERAALLHVAITGWTGKVADDDAKKVVADTFHSDESRIDTRKMLVDPEILRGVRNAAQRARVYHYLHTVPWFDKGLRLIKATEVDNHGQFEFVLNAINVGDGGTE